MKRHWATLRQSAAAISFLLAVIAMLAINLAAGLTLGGIRLDLTEGHIYTLSPVTRDILDQLDEPVHLRFYVSPALTDISGQYSNYAAHVRELLDIYRRKSHGRITLEIISPEPFSPEEDRAFGFGLHGQPIDNDGNQAFFGIVGTNSTDETQTIPFLTPEREVFLEYDLTRLIASLGTPKKQIVGLIDGGITSGHGPHGEAWAAIDQLRQLFTVQSIAPTADHIDPTVSVLLIVHPKALDPALLFAIDQYVLAGGHALVFVDPDAESISAAPSQMEAMLGGGGQGGGASDMPALFRAWGILYDPAKVVADWQQALRIQAENHGRSVVTAFPPYIAVEPPYLNADDPVIGDLKKINLVTAGALMQADGARTIFTALIKSSPHAALVDVADVSLNADPLAFLDKYKPGDETFTMAARIIGPVASAFPDGPPKAAGGKSAPVGPYLKESAKPVDIIVAADVDMLADHSWVETSEMGGERLASPFASNGDFLINAVENLTGSPALSSLRARGVASRPLTRIEDLQRLADMQYRETEESLSHKLEEARRQLLTASKTGTAASPGEVQQDTIKRVRSEMAETRNALRDVERNLRHDIDRLEARIKFLNIILMPLAVVVFSLLLAFGRPIRLRRRQ